ncbi:programmed cell death protein 2-like [Dermatophagoides pteronyssinus]|uniref:programmed cell death protein 2-like n=1 Tax=Dermatophagoides pteronyssinus TaxID=6956 RepID=UPI003F668FFB
MVFLGIIDEKIKIIDHHEQCSWLDNKLGGQPIFNPMFDVNKLIENDQLQCTECSINMAFILQIYCPVDNSNDDRILYFFSCVNKDCSMKKCRLFRIVTKAKQATKIETKLFDDDDWGGDNESTSDSTFTTEQSSNNVGSTNKYDFEKHSYFIPHYISVIEETDESIDNEKYEKMAKQIANVEENFINEQYEKHYPDVFQNDKDNYKFYKQLHKCPEQIMRYEFAGKPLKSSGRINFSIETCKNCKSKRIFELQLMPSLINVLLNNKMKTIDQQDISIDFETILIYTCGKNCYSTTNEICEEQVFLFKEYCPELNEKFFEFIPVKQQQ